MTNVHISVHRRVQKWHVSSKRPNVSMPTEIMDYTTCKKLLSETKNEISASMQLHVQQVYMKRQIVTQIYNKYFKHYIVTFPNVFIFTAYRL